MADDNGKTEERTLRRPGHHRPRGSRGGAQAPWHVHRLDRRARPAPPRLGGRRQLGRRGARRPRAPRSTSPSTPTTRSPSSTTAAASPSRCTRRRASRRSRSCSPSCTPAASSATAAATRSPAACTASASRSSTRCPSCSRSRSAATASPGPQEYARGAPQCPLEQGRADEGDRHPITFLPDAEIFEDTELRLGRRSSSACARRRSSPAACASAHRRARRGQAGRVPLRRRHRGLRHAPQREQGADRPQGHLLRGRERRGPGRDRDAVEHDLPGVDPLLRQQHQHARGRLAPLGLPLRADAHDQPLRAQGGPLLKEKDDNLSGEDVREGLTAVISAKLSRPAVRGPDEDQARQPRAWRASSRRSSTRSSPSSSRRTRRRRARSSARPSPPRRRARPRARPAT